MKRSPGRGESASAPTRAATDSPAYPPAMQELERAFMNASRDARGVPPFVHDTTTPRLGVAVSGGGIRSATFALGLFQGMAERGVLRHIDFLSTVSGGGYFGAFYGSLFSREYVTRFADVPWILQRDGAVPPGSHQDLPKARAALDWLRENGRYLAPRGSADMLLAAATVLRNWLAIQGLIGTALLLLFLLLQAPRVFGSWFVRLGPATAHPAIAGPIRDAVQKWAEVNAGVSSTLPFAGAIWWDPWTLLPLVCAGISFSVGWAYWLSITSPTRTRREGALRGFLWVVLFVAAYALPRGEWSHGLSLTLAGQVAAVIFVLASVMTYLVPADGVPVGLFLAFLVMGPVLRKTATVPHPGDVVVSMLGSVCALSLVFVVAAKWAAKTQRVNTEPTAAKDKTTERILQTQYCRTYLTATLRWWLLVTVLIGGIVLVDSLGQTIYATSAAGYFKPWLAGIAAAGGTLTAYARKLVVLLSPTDKSKRPSVPVSLMAGAAALVLALALLLGYDVLSHGIAWNFECAAAPAPFAQAHLTPQQGAPASSCAENPARPSARLFGYWLVGCALLTYAFGRTFSFLNFSSHQVLYSARLTRAYLGASNRDRWKKDAKPVTDPIPGDDIEIHKYWPVPRVTAPFTNTPYNRGCPLHLVNVTINETFGGKSQVQQQDRKGLAMALGPAGVSVGVRHHVVYGADHDPATPSWTERCAAVAKALRADTSSGWSSRARQALRGKGVRATYDHTRFIGKIYPEQSDDVHRVFDYDVPGDDDLREFPVEPLSLGRWIGISGAAFSTGIGFRTSLGLSVLAGLTNIRLGYWWDSGLRPRWESRGLRSAGKWLTRALMASFPVHTYLAYELGAHFPGTSRRHWYLSDGGHFENMGGYELLRRRLPLIVIVDAEADPDYTFEGIANLVRKARIDFAAEIDFGTPCHDREPVRSWLDANAFAANLNDLRPVPCNPPVLELRRSAKRAASATITYADGSTGCLVYVKPTITGDEPLDVREYARSHEAFPQETTADQFFDEAQWESYRKLGEHIGTQLFVG